MARKLRIQFKGAIYHLTIRGIERRNIFRDDHDRLRFLAQLAEAGAESGVRLYLYCLMNNHAHLLAETPRANVSAFMHRLQTAYTVYFNRKHQRVGHLVQGRFSSKLVQGDQYLLNLSRYIHLNPVFAGIMAAKPLKTRRQFLRNYRWSSYRGYAGLSSVEDIVDRTALLSMMPGKGEQQRKAYRTFVESGLATTDEEFRNLVHQSPLAIGNPSFQEQAQQRYAHALRETSRPEDVALRRLAFAHNATSVIQITCEEAGATPQQLTQRSYRQPARAIAMWALGKYAGLSQREIAETLQVKTGAAVCQAIRRLKMSAATDHQLQAVMRQIERRLVQ
ncbi:MAG TPA: transposase [Kiritimatiellia bacterium]|jgi:REP element-mobilizing transposase RayT|nr:transposase [Kiritimatiellia bacterium]OQC60078.1 MAG: Transposase IS200 like protein [Verrucomicrobia bacterium ADurb.Bin018]MBP9572529.1 transposase [Kiritimatiellia bacterium]HOE00424.1 transposase [Kiritimatiellia bacterium]HOE36671.1 transposase [Kiritimatiellia bacterium]